MKPLTQYTYITKADSITVYVKGGAYTASSTHPNYGEILNAIKEGEPEEVMLDLLDTKKAITTYIGKEIMIENGVLLYRGKELRNSLTVKILRMMDEGFDIEPMLNFLVNLRANPSNSAQEELMLFMEANDMPLTPEGYFLSYKSVREDFKDFHSGKFDNSIGAVCEMERTDVDDRRNVTCSHGLHIGAKEYAGTFGGSGHLMIVKVNPKDVVSIPYDYNNMKGRVCRYEVIGEVPRAKDGPDKYNQSAVFDETLQECRCPYCGSTDTNTNGIYSSYCYDCGEEF